MSDYQDQKLRLGILSAASIAVKNVRGLQRCTKSIGDAFKLAVNNRTASNTGAPAKTKSLQR